MDVAVSEALVIVHGHDNVDGFDAALKGLVQFFFGGQLLFAQGSIGLDDLVDQEYGL